MRDGDEWEAAGRLGHERGDWNEMKRSRRNGGKGGIGGRDD